MASSRPPKDQILTDMSLFESNLDKIELAPGFQFIGMISAPFAMIYSSKLKQGQIRKLELLGGKSVWENQYTNNHVFQMARGTW